MTKTDTPKVEKKKGPIRTEAVIPFLIVVILTYVYFHFFFDLHLKKAFEFGGYHLLGAEVDINKVETSFFKGTFRVQGIQVTNGEKPTHNMVEIGDIRFGVLWDGLLRARLIVNEMAVEQIEIDTQRKKPGQVKPPDPDVPADPNAPSAAEKLKDKALGKVESKYEKNVLGDIASILGGTSSDDQLQKIEGSIPSKARVAELEADYKAKQKKWQEKINSLPKGPEIQALGNRLGKVKTKDFKSPQELQQSLSEIDAIVKEADAKYKAVQSTSSELSTDMKTLDQELKALDAMVKKDIKDLEARFKIPSLDPKSLSQSIFYPYLSPYLAKFNRYKAIAEKYVPPNLMEKGQKADEPAQIQPRPRAEGVSYEFTHPKSYPMFWVKKILVTSVAGASPNSGNIKGLVTDVTSNQMLIGKPTVAKLDGDFPGMQVQDFHTQLVLDNTKPVSRIGYEFSVGSYPLDGKELVQSPDVQVSFKKANGGVSSKGELLGLRDFSFTMDNRFKNVDYVIGAKEPVAQEILKDIFAGLPPLSLEVSGSGVLPGISLNINSNLGPELSKGFEKQLQKKLAEARVKLQAYIDEQVGSQKAKLEADFNKAKSQVEGEIKKVQAQLDGEKAKAQAKVDQAKKDTENRAKKAGEDQVKKAAEDLKKKLGF